MQLPNDYIQCVPGKKEDQKYFLHNKFAHTIIFVKQHRECTGELIIEQLFTSPNRGCYFALQNVKVAILLHHNARQDSLQGQAYK